MTNWTSADWHLETQTQHAREFDAQAFGEAVLEIAREIGQGIAWTAARVTQAWRDGAEDLARRRLIRTTTKELAALDDRTLSDIGLHRSEIPGVAAEIADTGGAPRSVHEVRVQAGPEGARHAQAPFGLLRHQPAGCG